MFTIEIKINGAMIGHIYGRNVKDMGNGQNEYDYEYYEPEQRNLKKGTVSHARSDGIRKLVNKILTDIDNK